MTISRYRQVCLESTPYYHCTTRCVRRAYLCGNDPLTGNCFDHRKQWLVDKMKVLANLFAIDLCAYAVMSNHYHLVLRVDRERAKAWTDSEVIDRWYQLFNGHPIVDRLRADEVQTQAELAVAAERIEVWRNRLYDLSWFMRCLNQNIAYRSNLEEGCKGRFWEGRFKSQALLDEAALLTCMSYVDLNPVRAGIADTPETSEFTSIYERIKVAKATTGESTPKGLIPLSRGECHLNDNSIPFSLQSYLELVDWTGRAIRGKKTASIPYHLAPIVTRIGIDLDRWVSQVKYYGRPARKAIGARQLLVQFCEKMGQAWLWGQSAQSYG